MSYQTVLTESIFSARVDLTSVARVNRVAPELAQYPRFPLTGEAEMVIPWVLTEAEENLLSSLSVDEENIHPIEKSTVESSASDMWRKERTYRFTASKFHAVTKRQRNHGSFAESLMHPKPFSSK